MKYTVLAVLMSLSMSIFSQIEVLADNRVQIGSNPFTSDWKAFILNQNKNIGLSLSTKPFTGNNNEVVGFKNYLKNGSNVLKTGIENKSYQEASSNKMLKGIYSQSHLYGTANGSASIYSMAYVDNSSYGSKYGIYSLIRNFNTSAGTGDRVALYAGDPDGIGLAAKLDGNVEIHGNLTLISDIKLKTEIKDIPNISNRFMQLKPSQYKFIKEKSDEIHYGFIAQEVTEVFPELVKAVYQPGDPIVEITEDEEGNEIRKVVGEEEGEYIKGINYIEVMPLMVQMIQEQQKVIDDLKQRIELLEQK